MSKRTRSSCAYCNLPRAAIRNGGKIVREFPACVAHLDLLALDPSYSMDGYLADLDGVSFATGTPLDATASSGQRRRPRAPRARTTSTSSGSSRSSSGPARAMSP